MRTRRFERLGLALLLVIGCIVFGDRSLIEVHRRSSSPRLPLHRRRRRNRRPSIHPIPVPRLNRVTLP